MRWVHIAIVVLFAATTLDLPGADREIVSMDFLGLGIRAALASIAASFYLRGAIMGRGAYALLRRSVQAVSATTAAPPPRSARSYRSIARFASNASSSIGRRAWKSLRIAKQAAAAARCLSVCPLRIDPAEKIASS